METSLSESRILGTVTTIPTDLLATHLQEQPQKVDMSQHPAALLNGSLFNLK